MAAGEAVAAPLSVALDAGGGYAVWQSGTLWKCPGCGDRTVRTEEFLEGMQRAERYLRLHSEHAINGQREADGGTEGSSLRALEAGSSERREREGESAGDTAQPMGAALAWLDLMAMRMLGCERDRVYIKDEGGTCPYGNTTYTSRI